MDYDITIPDSTILGHNISRLRKEAGLKQAELVERLNAYDLHMSRAILAQMECGMYNVRVSELSAMRDIFQTDYSEFFRLPSSDAD